MFLCEEDRILRRRRENDYEEVTKWSEKKERKIECARISLKKYYYRLAGYFM